MKTRDDLRKLLLSIDHRGYPAYKETRGRWAWDTYTLSIDHVQGDPFASPSNVSVIVPGRTAAFPPEYLRERHRRVALQDQLLRCFSRALAQREQRRAGSGKSGLVATSRPGQEILERTACQIDPSTGDVTMRFEVGFPANGRTINARELLVILEEHLPEAVSSALIYRNMNRRALGAAMELADDQRFIRAELKARNLAAFVADGSILPRQSGISALPMKEAVPFQSPEELAVTLTLPHKGALRGMGIRRGITLIVGGGYHGKSTLLQALERGVYDHIRGDGREYVITDSTAVKVRAEDGRAITATDISLFINDLPSGRDTLRFSTEDASGSTSQAANVVEAMEAGAQLLLMDEDTSATNFMVRDSLMARVVSPDKEPITPFLSRIRDLYEQMGISTILVAGSSGSFFHVADTVIQMDRYIPREITALAKEEARAAGDGDLTVYRAGHFRAPAMDRKPRADAALSKNDRIKLKLLSLDSFLIDRDEVVLRGLEQLADREQTAGLAHILKYMQLHVLDGKMTLREAVSLMEKELQAKGLEILFDGGTRKNGLAQVRPQEICGMLSRYRRLRV